MNRFRISDGPIALKNVRFNQNERVGTGRILSERTRKIGKKDLFSD
jgi:hypothetical protein